MKSFKSFNVLKQEEVPIERVLDNYLDYHAHTHRTEPFEKLHEHVHLVMRYALKLIKVHGLDDVVDRLISEIIEANSEGIRVDIVGNFIKRLFINTLVFHDYGKVNENFQIEKMGDTKIFRPNEKNGIGSQHSILSSFIFLNIHLNEIIESKNLSRFEVNLLIACTLLFSNPILKHHSSFLQHKIEFDAQRIDGLASYLELFRVSLNPKLKAILEGANKALVLFSEYLNQKTFFPLFALLKLNFSLLTASDYYATNDFMQKMPVRDFGVIYPDFRQRLTQNFIKNKASPYNGELMKRMNHYLNLPFSDLRDRSSENLNLLRQKMAAEALINLRQNLDQKIYYLEAPTGGGKTNMSFACTLELLQADKKLNKVYYVFPFTTLITQTYSSIKETLKLNEEEVIQLHSKAGFHSPKREGTSDGIYGNQRLNYINNLFINYPFTLLSHIKFFDILKGNGKDVNYILHRISNSVVIIDELQTYSPAHWDKIIYFLHQYARHFNIRFILMSATLPKIDKLSKEATGKVTYLISNKHEYFTNANFKGRVDFDFSLLGKNGRQKIELPELADAVWCKLNAYGEKNEGKVHGLIEFIIKKTASDFLYIVRNDRRFADFEIFLISGTILETRRQEVIRKIKEQAYNKMLVITTQVVEAGVDIDMDIGFKDKSLIDSDEQLAGRVNRNARKNGSKVFIFHHDKESKVYRKDKRYEITREQISHIDYQSILRKKDFDKLYNKVHDHINKLNENDYFINLNTYKSYFKSFDFQKIHQEFRLIEDNTTSVFVPLEIEAEYFSKNEIKFLNSMGEPDLARISGERVFDIYKKILLGEEDFVHKAINKKQITGILSKFMFSIYTNSTLESQLKPYHDHEIYEQFGIHYLSHYEDVYSYENGINDKKFEEVSFL